MGGDDEPGAWHRHENLLRASGKQRDAERFLALGVVLPQFAIVEADRQCHVRGRELVVVAHPIDVDAFTVPDAAKLRRHGVPRHATQAVPHRRLEPDPDGRALGRLCVGPRTAGKEECRGKQEANRHTCRHRTVSRLTKWSCLHSPQRVARRYRTTAPVNTGAVPTGYRVPLSGRDPSEPAPSQTMRNAAPLAALPNGITRCPSSGSPAFGPMTLQRAEPAPVTDSRRPGWIWLVAAVLVAGMIGALVGVRAWTRTRAAASLPPLADLAGRYAGDCRPPARRLRGGAAGTGIGGGRRRVVHRVSRRPVV